MPSDIMAKYKFYWLDGSVSEGEGNNAAEALNNLGFGAGATRALDYWEKVEASNAQ
jgi:hypothetical protein